MCSKKHPSPPSAWTAVGEEGHTDNLKVRVDRYSKAKDRSSQMQAYLIKKLTSLNLPDYQKSHSQLFKASSSLEDCGSYLVFRQWLETGEVRLAGATTCKQHLLCNLCAILRGARLLQAYTEKLEQIQENSDKLHMITLTQPHHDESLIDSFKRLMESFSSLKKTLRNYKAKGTGKNAFCNAEGVVYSVEVKRGKNSGLWHPHIHMVTIGRNIIDPRGIKEIWHQCQKIGNKYTVDQIQAETHEVYGDSIEAFKEVTKYALKFNSMEHSDTWEAYEALRGKRMIGTLGRFRGVTIPEKESLDLDGVFVDLFYRWCSEMKRYQFEKTV